MFAALGAFIYRKRWATLVVSLLFLVASIAMVARGGKLTSARFGDNEAWQTEHLVEQVVGHATNTTFVVIFHSDTKDPRNEPFQAAMKAALAPLSGDPRVLSVMSPDDAPPALAPGMVNGNAKSAVAMVSLVG